MYRGTGRNRRFCGWGSTRAKSTRAGHRPADGRRLAVEQLERREMLDGAPIISELMASNQTTLADGDYVDGPDYPDWLELYNPTDQPIVLSGWKLRDDSREWIFPESWQISPPGDPAHYQSLLTLDPGEYLVVMASEKGRDPDKINAYGYYIDSADYLHTNFALKAGGEYLGLLRPDGTVAHEFAPEYPEQETDISYGLVEAGSLDQTLVGPGAQLSFHVPAAGEDPRAWTSRTYDDSAWLDSVDPASLVVTEVSTGDTRFVEVENVSGRSIDTAGWQVVVNDALGGVNAVNATAWALPASVAAGQVLYRTDDVGDQYWGATIDWGLEGPGWVMIVDASGRPVDFVAWGYTASQIASLNVSFGDFRHITVGDQWSGNGAPVGSAGGGAPTSGWVAFNDHVAGAGTAANTTTYSTIGTNSGLLKDIESGQNLPVTLTTTQSGMNAAGTQANPAPGTDAYNIFHGYVDFGSAAYASLELQYSDYYTYEFSGLDTGDSATYNFCGTAVRGDSGYTDRWTLVTLVGADAFTPAHSDGVGVVTSAQNPSLGANQVAIWTGYNSAAGQGFVAAWTGIDPGPDGVFSVKSEQYRGPIPTSVDPAGVADGGKGYGISGIRLEEIVATGPQAWLERTGGADGDTAADFVRTGTDTKGLENPDLEAPFVEQPATTGIGFSNNQPAFDQLIQTDVGDLMQGASASLFTRIEFYVDDPGHIERLTLSMKYDDGFVAYINGMRVAGRNDPDPLASDSAATAEHPNAEAVVYEEFDVSAALINALEPGRNVLAIHGLNVGVSDGDFLLVPKLVATSRIVPQYMATPTPGQLNVAGTLGFVADTKFSVDRGFYDEPFWVEITTDTGGADIYYTLDGSSPLLAGGSINPSALRYAETGPVHVTTTTTLRAAACKAGYTPTDVDTQTYIFLADVAQQDGSGLPPYANWGYLGPDWEVDPEIADDVLVDSSGQTFTLADALKSLPTVSLVTDWDNWFSSAPGEPLPNGLVPWQGIYADMVAQHGAERVVSMEYFTADGLEQFAINGAVQIIGGGIGGTSANRWKSNKLSMRVKFKEQYGAPELDYPLFGPSAADEFDTLVLDAHLNWTWNHNTDATQRNGAKFIQDAFVSDLQNAMSGQGAPHGQFVHLYINGLYWGMYELHERPDEHFASEYYGGQDDDYDAIKHVARDTGGADDDYDGDPYNDNISNGTADNLNLMLNLSRQDMSVQANYDQVATLLDIDSFIDYILANFYAGNTDWSHKNWYATYNTADPNAKWHYHSWDAEHVLDSISATTARGQNVTGDDDYGGPSELHQNLVANAEYRMRFADRVQKMFFNGGPLSEQGAAALFQARISEVERAVLAESARWGDTRDATPHTQPQWYAHMQDFLTNYFPYRTSIVLGQLQQRGLFPYLDAPVLGINGAGQHGGEIEPGDWLTMTNPDGTGTIYYTLDGSDPRLSGGAISGSAIAWQGPVQLDHSVPVMARVLSSGTWSALADARYHTALPPGVAISEINYNPYDPTPEEITAGYTDNNDFEFIELKNISDQQVSLLTVHFAAGLSFDFTGTDVTSLAPGEYAVVARNAAAFAFRYGSGHNLAGQYTGSLENAGEQLQLAHGLDTVFLDFAYGDAGNWPGRADGKGATLELIDPENTWPLDYGDSAAWRSSVAFGGTPGADPLEPVGIVINEVLTHTDDPLTDAIELYNPTGQTIDIAGWYLSDEWGFDYSSANGDYRKFEIPALDIGGAGKTVLGPGEYLVFYHGHWVDDPDDGRVLEFDTTVEFGGYGPKDFALSSAGDDVWLMEADTDGNLTRFVDHVSFGGEPNGESLGRWPDGTGVLYPLLSRTLGTANVAAGNGPRFGPLVVSEVMYWPAAPTSEELALDPYLLAEDFEYIELHNPSASAVNLRESYDGTVYPWTLEGHEFAADASLGAGQTMLVLSFNPANPENASRLAAFRGRYGLDESVILAGGFSGKLDNAGESISLERPDEPFWSPGGEFVVPFLLMDEVRYGQDSPGSVVEVAGEGQSLQRVATDAWGLDAASWQAGVPTPGTVDFVLPPAEVVDRHVFYNNSVFDGYDPAAGPSDDLAIDDGKQALVPGPEAVEAGFANWTSYARGINGIMIDAAGLHGTPTAADFVFRAGNSGDPDLWPVLSAAPQIAVRDLGGGVSRVTLVWEDGTVRNEWLQVRMLATEATGLAGDDVFYFGNLVGETGDAPSQAAVDENDLSRAAGAVDLGQLIGVEDSFDFDRDGIVNFADLIRVRNAAAAGSQLAPLYLEAVPSGAALLSGGAASAALSPDVLAGQPTADAAAYDATLAAAVDGSEGAWLEATEWLWFYELERPRTTSETKTPARDAAAVDLLLQTWDGIE